MRRHVVCVWGEWGCFIVFEGVYVVVLEACGRCVACVLCCVCVCVCVVYEVCSGVCDLWVWVWGCVIVMGVYVGVWCVVWCVCRVCSGVWGCGV